VLSHTTPVIHCRRWVHRPVISTVWDVLTPLYISSPPGRPLVNQPSSPPAVATNKKADTPPGARL